MFNDSEYSIKIRNHMVLLQAQVLKMKRNETMLNDTGHNYEHTCHMEHTELLNEIEMKWMNKWKESPENTQNVGKLERP